jgi:hypothetical protein
MQTWLSPFAQNIPFIILDACEYHNTDEEGLSKNSCAGRPWFEIRHSKLKSPAVKNKIEPFAFI